LILTPEKQHVGRTYYAYFLSNGNASKNHKLVMIQIGEVFLL